jgi:hypothetical protein
MEMLIRLEILIRNEEGEAEEMGEVEDHGGNEDGEMVGMERLKKRLKKRAATRMRERLGMRQRKKMRMRTKTSMKTALGMTQQGETRTFQMAPLVMMKQRNSGWKVSLVIIVCAAIEWVVCVCLSSNTWFLFICAFVLSYRKM